MLSAVYPLREGLVAAKPRYDITIELENYARKINNEAPVSRPNTSNGLTGELGILNAHQQIIAFYNNVQGDILNNNPQNVFEMSFGGLMGHIGALPENQRIVKSNEMEGLKKYCLKHWKAPTKRRRQKDIRKCISLMKPQIDSACDALAKAYDFRQASGTLSDFFRAAQNLEFLVRNSTFPVDKDASEAQDLLAGLHIDEARTYLGKFSSFILEFKDLHIRFSDVYANPKSPKVQEFKAAMEKFGKETNPISMPKNLRWYLYKQQIYWPE